MCMNKSMCAYFSRSVYKSQMFQFYNHTQHA